MCFGVGTVIHSGLTVLQKIDTCSFLHYLLSERKDGDREGTETLAAPMFFQTKFVEYLSVGLSANKEKKEVKKQRKNVDR